MTSPFPGMDPYLEEYNWPDFHTSLAYKLRGFIDKALPAGFIVQLEVSVIEESTFIKTRYRPDIGVNKQYGSDGPSMLLEEPIVAYGTLIATPPTAVFQRTVAETNMKTITITDKKGGRLIAAVEILSPFSKRQPNLDRYRAKREAYFSAGVHLLEIDLLRAGSRPVYEETWPEATYAIQTVNAFEGKVSLWALDLQANLPVVKLPLAPLADPILVNLDAAFADVYDEASYHKAIDYSLPLERPLVREIDRKFLETMAS